MFLNNLSMDEKKAFMSMVRKLVLSDGTIDEFEQKIIEGFCHEMKISPDDNKNEFNWKKSIEIINKSTNTVKRSVLVELLSACYSNNVFDEKQMMEIEKIRASWGVPEDFVIDGSNWVKKIIQITSEGYRLVKGI